ncbi:hypothetical protein [Nocardioides sp. CFH 31398]|uniref:hypothetical protein n=1 Tax=Nocardioides sp. CFH 31398 TaxID=2919579 RepID=UPI001F05578A|nr:hypothetical protein [Nocardioides sp. CFH 31398]MCH1867840.1 hypothetical protein [Nocardioides sp. CFH 31398]
MSLTRRLAAVAAPVLLVSTLSGCGGVGGAPTDASVEDYCGAQVGLLEYFLEAAGSGEQPPADEAYDEVQSSIDEQEETGTPEDMPDDARTAWEEQIDEAKDVSEDDFTEAYDSGDSDELDDLTGGDSDDEGAQALADYNTEACADQFAELGGGDVPTP